MVKTPLLHLPITRNHGARTFWCTSSIITKNHQNQHVVYYSHNWVIHSSIHPSNSPHKNLSPKFQKKILHSTPVYITSLQNNNFPSAKEASPAIQAVCTNAPEDRFHSSLYMYTHLQQKVYVPRQTMMMMIGKFSPFNLKFSPRKISLQSFFLLTIHPVITLSSEKLSPNRKNGCNYQENQSLTK